MFAQIVTIVVILSTILGGTAATAYAAQDDMPGQPLYGLKLYTEDARLGLALSTQTRLNLNLEFANRRVDEIAFLAAKDQVPPEQVLNRLQTQLDQALKVSAGLDDQGMQAALQGEMQSLQIQERTLQQVQLHNGSPAEPALLQAREMIRAQLQIVEGGLADPVQLRERLRNQLQEQAGTPGKGPGTITPPAGTPPGNGLRYGPGEPGSTTTPGGSYGPGPGPSSTCTPGSSYGPGPGPASTATSKPGGSYGPNPSQTPGGSGGPVPQQTTTHGSGYGPGPGPEPSSTCTPGSGPGASQTPNGPGGPGGGGGKGNP